MYACIRETGEDFSRGCAGRRIGHLLFTTYPHSPFTGHSEQHLTVGGCELYAVGTHYQTLLKRRDRGARLQRNHVPPPHLPHHPHGLRIGYEYLAYAVSVGPAGPVLEHYLISLLQRVEVIEDHTTPGSPKAHAVSCQVDVPLSTL